MARAPNILIVDESLDDFLVLKRAFARVGVVNPVHWTRSGQETMQFLNGNPPHDDRESSAPSVILLDLDMPDMNAFELLGWIRHKFPSGGLLIVVLTRLENIRKLNRAYSLGANSFLAKPVRPEELQELIQIFGGYWLLNSRVPKPAQSLSSSMIDHFRPDPHEHN